MKNCDIIMGYMCNNNCMHCIRQDNDRQTNLSTGAIKKLIDDADKRGVKRIILQGGEPTIRKDLFEIISYIREKEIPQIQIQSNGRMLSYPAFAKQVSDLGITEFCISVHSNNAKVHDEFTGARESFNQTIKGIRNLISLGQHVKILFILTKKNYKNLTEVIDMLYRIGVRHFQIGVPNPEGGALNNFHNVIPKFSEIKPYVIDVLEKFGEKAFIRTQDIPKCFLPGFEEHVLEDSLPEAEKLYPEKEILDHEAYRKGNKAFASSCGKCRFRKECEGVYRTYLSEYGESEF